MEALHNINGPLGNFADLSMYAGHGNIEQNYFGSEHGKGEGDDGCVNKATEKTRLGRWL